MPDDGWRPAETAPYDVPVLVRQEGGMVQVAWKVMLPPSRRVMWFHRPYPPRGVTEWRPIEPEPSACVVDRSLLEEALSGLLAFTGGRDGACRETVAKIEAALAKEKTDG